MVRALATPPPGSGLRPVMGSAGLPYVGRSLEYIRDPLSLWKRQEARFGRVSWHTIAGRRTVLVLGADGCEEILANHDKAFSSTLAWRPLMGPFFDNGLMLMDAGEHRRHRRLLQQAFTVTRLDAYASAMEPLVASAVESWQTAPRPAATWPAATWPAATWPAGDRLEIYPAVKELTLGVATEIFMGGVRDGDDRLGAVNRAFVDCVQAPTSIVRVNVPGTRWRRGLVGRRFLENFLREYLPDRRIGNGTDLFTVLAQLEDVGGERFPDDAVIDHMIFLLMAAHDTSTITISTMVDHLGRHPHWQDECRRQSRAVGRDVSSRDARARLTALDSVMKESLRLLAPLPTMARWTVRDTAIQGHHVPANTMVAATPHYSHHDPALWTDPETFDPTRFDGRALPHKYAWQPFGGGVHTCLGQFFSAIEILMVVHHMLLNYSWTSSSDGPTPIDFTSLPYPKDGQPVRLARL